jgi:hypothetical protein
MFFSEDEKETPQRSLGRKESPLFSPGEANPSRVFRQSSSRATSQDEIIKIGTFMLYGELKHFAVVPPLKLNSSKDLQELMKYWELSTPNFILAMIQATKNRDSIITAENAPNVLRGIFQPDRKVKILDGKRSESYETENEFTESSNSHTGSSWNLIGWLTKIKKENRRELENVELENISIIDTDWKWINKYLQRKTIHALSSVVSAADMTGGLILCHGAASSNEKMLETAMEDNGACPNVLVVDRMQEYEKLLVDSEIKKKALGLDKIPGVSCRIVVSWDNNRGRRESHLPDSMCQLGPIPILLVNREYLSIFQVSVYNDQESHCCLFPR